MALNAQAVREAILTELRSKAPSAYRQGGDTSQFSDEKVSLGLPGTLPADDPWALFLIQHIDRRRTSYGTSARMAVEGQVLIDLHSRSKQPDNVVPDAQQFAAIFDVGKLDTLTAPTIYFTGSRIHERGIQDNDYVVWVRAPFYYYEQA